MATFKGKWLGKYSIQGSYGQEHFTQQTLFNNICMTYKCEDLHRKHLGISMFDPSCKYQFMVQSSGEAFTSSRQDLGPPVSYI